MHYNINRLLVLTALGVAITITTLQAQQSRVDTFKVTVVDKTPAHPYYGIGSSRGCAVNGIEGDTLIVVRDSLYVFNVREPEREFYFQFYTIPIGGTQGVYDGDFIKQQDITRGIWTVRASRETRDTLYYASPEEPWVGGTILVVDSLPTSSVAEERRVLTTGESRAVPNPCTDGTELRFASAEGGRVSVELVDLLGRRVLHREESSVPSGEQSLRIGTEGMESGLYHYRITITGSEEEQIITGQLRVLK